METARANIRWMSINQPDGINWPAVSQPVKFLVKQYADDDDGMADDPDKRCA